GRPARQRGHQGCDGQLSPSADPGRHILAGPCLSPNFGKDPDWRGFRNSRPDGHGGEPTATDGKPYGDFPSARAKRGTPRLEERPYHDAPRRIPEPGPALSARCPATCHHAGVLLLAGGPGALP